MTAIKQKAQRELWWKQAKAQRVWIEITRRPDKDIGVDINNRSTEFLKHLQIAKKVTKFFTGTVNVDVSLEFPQLRTQNQENLEQTWVWNCPASFHFHKTPLPCTKFEANGDLSKKFIMNISSTGKLSTFLSYRMAQIVGSPCDPDLPT